MSAQEVQAEVYAFYYPLQGDPLLPAAPHLELPPNWTDEEIEWATQRLEVEGSSKKAGTVGRTALDEDGREEEAKDHGSIGDDDGSADVSKYFENDTPASSDAPPPGDPAQMGFTSLGKDQPDECMKDAEVAPGPALTSAPYSLPLALTLVPVPAVVTAVVEVAPSPHPHAPIPPNVSPDGAALPTEHRVHADGLPFSVVPPLEIDTAPRTKLRQSKRKAEPSDQQHVAPHADAAPLGFRDRVTKALNGLKWQQKVVEGEVTKINDGGQVLTPAEVEQLTIVITEEQPSWQASQDRTELLGAIKTEIEKVVPRAGPEDRRSDRVMCLVKPMVGLCSEKACLEDCAGQKCPWHTAVGSKNRRPGKKPRDTDAAVGVIGAHTTPWNDSLYAALGQYITTSERSQPAQRPINVRKRLFNFLHFNAAALAADRAPLMTALRDASAQSEAAVLRCAALLLGRRVEVRSAAAIWRYDPASGAVIVGNVDVVLHVTPARHYSAM